LLNIVQGQGSCVRPLLTVSERVVRLIGRDAGLTAPVAFSGEQVPEFSEAEQDRARAAAACDRRLAVALESAGYGLTRTLAAAPGYCTSQRQAEAPGSWSEQALAYAAGKLHGATALSPPQPAWARSPGTRRGLPESPAVRRFLRRPFSCHQGSAGVILMAMESVQGQVPAGPSGLGTAGLYPWKRARAKPAEDQGLVIPRFGFPWPSACHPDAAGAEQGALAFVARHGLAPDAEHWERLVRTRYGWLAARCYPQADRELLQITADYFTWFFIADDLFVDRVETVTPQTLPNLTAMIDVLDCHRPGAEPVFGEHAWLEVHKAAPAPVPASRSPISRTPAP
jgi:hypothetical protein